MFGHRLLKMAAWPGERRFAVGRAHLESVQRQKLALLLRKVAACEAGQRQGVAAHWQWETFAEQVPVSDYDHWRDPVDRAREYGGNA